MKRTTTVLTLLLIALSIMAGPVTPRKAASRMQAFKRLHAWFKGAPELAYQANRPNGEGCYYYIYTPAQSQGFVIVSGDDRTESILGYCDEGTFLPERMPANMASWLRTYEQAIEQMDSKGTAPSAYTPSDEIIEPLISTRWDQDYPYNLYCPDNCPTGCVATALAQVMNYHRWPQQATTAIPAYTTYSNNYDRPELPATTFAWDKMRNSYGNGSSQQSREAVALLMEYTGQALEMDYTPSGSGAQTFYIPWVVSEYFGYSNSAWVADRSDYSMGEWDELLLTELREHRPVLYTGYTCNWEGHAFVCDGYDGNGMYHINWGWGGYCDGHYRISLLDPDGSGIGGSSTSDRFNVSQSAIIGLSPEEVTTEQPSHRTLTAMERPSVERSTLTRENSTEDFAGITIHQWIVNGTGQSYYANTGYALFQGAERKAVLYSQNTHLWPTQATEQNITFSFGAGLPDGDYEICAVSKHLDNNQWAKDRGADRHFIRAHIAGNELTLQPVPQADFQVNEVRISGNKMTVSLTNPHEEFNGTVMLYTDEQAIAEEPAAIAAGETTNIYFYLSNDRPLTDADIYYLTVDHYEGNYFYCNGTNEGADLEPSIEIHNMAEEANGNIAYGGKLFYTLHLKNRGTGVYHYTINSGLHEISRDKMYNSLRFIANIAPGETLSLPMVADINAQMRNRPMQIELTHKAGKESVLTASSQFTCAKGAVFWHTDGSMSTVPAAAVITVGDDVVAAELSTAYTKDVTANSNPNTIYLLNQEIPAGLAGHNVVSYEGLTGKIDLYDGYPYLVPTAVTTDAIHYHHNSIGWSAVMLPFAPTEVRNDGGESITWSAGVNEGDSFYLFEPTKVSREGITLAAVEETEAFHPYFLYMDNRHGGEAFTFSLRKKSTLSPTLANDYRFVLDGVTTFEGTNRPVSPSGVFTLTGEQMTYSSGAVSVAPFRTYLTGWSSPSVLPLIFPFEVSTGIATAESGTEEHTGYVYNLQGQRLGTAADLPSLPRGIYIINGKKTTH